MDTTFTINDIRERVNNFEENMKVLDSVIADMNQLIRNAPLDNADITPRMHSLAAMLVKASDELHKLVATINTDISEASNELEATTRRIENTLG